MTMDPLGATGTPLVADLDGVSPVVKDEVLFQPDDVVAVEPAPNPAYATDFNEIAYADDSVRTVDFNSVARRSLPKLGRGNDTVLAQGVVQTQGVDIMLSKLPKALNYFRTQVGGNMGAFKAMLERFEESLSQLAGMQGRDREKAMFRALVEFGEAAKSFQAFQGRLPDASLPKNFAAALSGLINLVATEAATLNHSGRFSKVELTDRAVVAQGAAAKTAQVLTAMNATSLAKQVHDGTMTDAVRELLIDHGYDLQRDPGKIYDPVTKTDLSDADLDALADRVVNWAAKQLVEAEDRLTEAERTYVGGLSPDELGTYETLRADYVAMKQGLPPRNEREAVSQAYLKTTADFPEDRSVDEAFVERLMSPEGVKDDGSLTPAQSAFLANLGTSAKLENGAYHITNDPAVRKFLAKAVKLITQPSSPAGANLMKAFIHTVKVLNDVVRTAVSLGKDPYLAIVAAFNAFVAGGLELDRKDGARRTDRLKGKKVTTRKEPPEAKKKPGVAAPVVKPTDAGTRPRTSTVTPLAGAAAKHKAGQQWSDLLDTGREELRDANKRMVKARIEAIHEETVAKQQVYAADVQADANKAHADKAAK